MTSKAIPEKTTGSIINRFLSRIPILTPLQKRDFRILWIGESFSLLGDQFNYIALSWLTLQLTGSGLALGTVLMIGAIPRALFMLFGGALSDRILPQKIMIVSNISRAVVVALLAVIVFMDITELWHLYLFSAFFGTLDSFFHPAFSAIVPRVVDHDKLEAGNAILRGTHELSFLIGSVPAGVIIAMVDTEYAFAVNSVFFVVSAICLSTMRGIKANNGLSIDELHISTSPLKLRNVIREVKEGITYAFSRPAFRAFIIAIAAIDFSFAGPIDVGFAWLADNRFTGGSTDFGIVLATFGGGALLGTIIAGSVRFKWRGIVIAAIGSVLGIGLATYGFVPDVIMAVVLSVFMGIGVGIFNIMLVPWFQKEAPPHMLGRIMSLMTFASVGVMPFSFALSGMLVDLHAPAMFMVAGAMTLAAGLYLLSVPAVRKVK